MSPAQSAALAHLRAILKPGDTLHGIQRHRSRSGKSRSLSLVATAPELFAALYEIAELAEGGSMSLRSLLHCGEKARAAIAVGGELTVLDAHIARALDLSLDRKHGGIRTDAPGDELVYNLSRVLFPEGGAALVFRRI